MSSGAFTERLAEGEMPSSRICSSTRPFTSLGEGHLINAFVMEYSFALAVRKHAQKTKVIFVRFIELV